MSGAEDSLRWLPTSDSFTCVAQITSPWKSVYVVVPAGIEHELHELGMSSASFLPD